MVFDEISVKKTGDIREKKNQEMGIGQRTSEMRWIEKDMRAYSVD